MRKVIIFLLLPLFLYATDTVNLQLKWKNSFQFAGFYMAKEKGFYKNAGLNVNFFEYNRNINVINEVLKKKNYYGILDSSLFYWILKGKKIELLMPIFDHSPLCLVSTDMSVKTLRDIEKKHIVIDRYSLNSLPIIAMLKSKNIDIKKLKTNVSLYSIKNLLTKKGIYGIYDTDEKYYLDKKNIKYKIFEPMDYEFDFYGDILFTSKKESSNHPKKVKNFIEASRKGWDYAFKHIDETIKVILKKYNTQGFSYDKLDYEARKMQKYISRDFTFCNRRVNNIKNIYILLGMADDLVDIENYIFNPCELSSNEKEFIRSHVLRCISTTSWEPFNTMRNGKLAGISVEYWNSVKKRLNLKSDCEIDNSWSDILYKIKNKKADITISTTDTPDRSKYAIFSKSYVSYPIVLVTKNNIGFISNMQFLNNKKVAVGKNYTIEKLLKKNYPSIKIIETKNINEALAMVSNGEVFATSDVLPVVAYHINQYSFSNLKISGKTPWNFDLKFMLRDDYKPLLSALNKAIEDMREEEKIKILNQWISVSYQDGYSFQGVMRIVLVPLIIIFIILGWIVHLNKEIKKRKKLEIELEILATVDRLTSLNNRYKMDVALDEQIEISKRYKRPLSLIFFDIDYFKKVNDTYGHKTGDLVLVELSNLVAQALRKSDIFGRWGGEEFLIILPETKKDEAIKLAEKLRMMIEKHKFEKINKLTCSFGITEYRGNDDAEALVARVDEKLYKAKQNGRNRIYYTS